MISIVIILIALLVFIWSREHFSEFNRSLNRLGHLDETCKTCSSRVTNKIYIPTDQVNDASTNMNHSLKYTRLWDKIQRNSAYTDLSDPNNLRIRHNLKSDAGLNEYAKISFYSI